jgi:hypothetical protein
MNTRVIALSIVAALLAACASLYTGDENSPNYLVPAGSTLTLRQPLAIPPETAGVYLQDGRTMGYADVRRLYPYCKLELKTRRDVARTVTPDVITIVHTDQTIVDDATGEASAAPYTQLASNQLVDMGGESGGPTIKTFATRMRLHSEKQPDLARLVCAQQGYLVVDRHVTIGEIRRVLGELGAFTLKSTP